jgi:hypothetical protein
MRQFTIIDLFPNMACEYDRIATIVDTNGGIIITVHFIEYDEYLNNTQVIQKRKNGDSITGNVCIDLISHSQIVNKELMHNQNIPCSSHIEAVIEVSKIIDKYTLLANSSVFSELIMLKFEDDVNYKVGDKVLVSGSLELCDIV